METPTLGILSTTDDFISFTRSSVWHDLEGKLIQMERHYFDRAMELNDLAEIKELFGIIKAYRQIRHFIVLAAKSEDNQPINEFDRLRELLKEGQL